MFFKDWKLKFLKSLAFIGALAVFGCMQAVSISHTLALAESHQYQGWEAIAFVAGVETAFVVGLLLIILDRAQGKRLNAGTIVFFFIPSLVVGAANIRSGMGFGWVGLALGVVPPALVLAVEKVLTNTSSTSESTKKEPGWLTWIFGRSATTQSTSQPVESADHQPTKSTIDQPSSSGQPKVAVQPKPDSQPINQKDESAKISQPNVSQSTKSQPTNQPVVDHQPEVNQEPTNHSTSGQPGLANQPESANQSTKELAESAKIQPGISQPDLFDQSASQPEPINQEGNQPLTNQPKLANQSASRVAKSTIQPAGKLVEVAEKYRLENGKWPSERKLAELAGTSRHQAGKVLKQLKATDQPAKDNQSVNQ